jgi:hypothetical protein
MQTKSLLLAEKPLAITERQFKLLTLLAEASPNSVTKKQLADDIFDIIEKAQPLQQHLTFWLNKYHNVFRQRQDMCLLYVGMEDGLPYPSGVEQDVKKWLDNP